MEGSKWFVERETYSRAIKHPDTGEEATLTLRPLNAGDRAEFNEIRIMQDEEGTGSGQIRTGRIQILMVERAVIEWTLPVPKTPDSIAQLDPRVFDLIYEHVSFGNPKDDVDDGGKVVPLASAADDELVAGVS